MTASLSIFETQLKNSPNNGDFLYKTSLAEVTMQYKTAGLSDSRIQEVIAYKIADYKEHIGDHILFFMTVKNLGKKTKLELSKCWSSDFERLYGNWTLTDRPFKNIPYLN